MIHLLLLETETFQIDALNSISNWLACKKTRAPYHMDHMALHIFVRFLFVLVCTDVVPLSAKVP